MSTPALCTFMGCYWKDGTPRDSANQSSAHNGSNDDCTAQVRWRPDGINIAWSFYGRSDLVGSDGIANDLNQVIDQLIKDKVLPPPPKPKRNLLVNGSFEEGPSIRVFQPLDPGSTVIKGWTVTRGQIDLQNAHPAAVAADGKRTIDLHGTPGYGGIEQTFRTIKGKYYRLTFAMAGNPGTATTVKRMAVSITGRIGTEGKIREFRFDTTSKTLDAPGWVEFAWGFEAPDDETVLEFYTLMKVDPYVGPMLDHVRVEEQ
jgi:choice-of-anchor C domain-containing protein